MAARFGASAEIHAGDDPRTPAGVVIETAVVEPGGGGVQVRPYRRTDRGSGPVTALMVMGILALTFTIGITALFAAASDERSTAQHAADAAALAGARGILDEAPIALAAGFTTPDEIPLLLGGGVCVQTGRGEAFRLAQANHAVLTSYCYNVWTDTVRVSVRLTDSKVAETRASAVAESATTFQPADCALASTSTLVCGSNTLTVQFVPSASRFLFVALVGELDDRDPRLIG
jgi:hypothetical protein